MNIRSYAFYMLVSIVLCTSTHTKDFIFDFGGVLFLNNKLASFRHIGMCNVAECSIRLRINPLYIDQHIKKTLFVTLEKVAKVHDLNTDTTYHVAYDDKGNALPFLLCAWLQGTMKATEIRELVETTMSRHPEWFGCQAEQRIIQNLVHMILTPELFVDSVKVSDAGIAFVKRCKREGHKIYGLSNWDTESFALLKKNHPELFDLFDGIILSGQVHANKPHETIYHTLLDRYQLQAENCWFIDDQKENVVAAQKLGINAVVHNQNFQKLIKNIRLAHAQSLSLRKDFTNHGSTTPTSAKSTNSAMIDGEKISPTDSIDASCLPANE